MAEFVTMHHPITGGTATADRNAFNKVWSSLGWELVDEDSEYTQLSFDDVEEDATADEDEVADFPEDEDE